MTQLDKLLEIAAIENKLQKRELNIHGMDLSFWSKPTTIADFQAAKKASKNPEDSFFTLCSCSVPPPTSYHAVRGVMEML